LDNAEAGGLLLMGAAVLALIVANSPLAEAYFASLAIHLGPLSVNHWINDGLMALFFLFVGLEIKREVLDGQLATWGNRVLPGAAALGGMAVPALIYVAFNSGNEETLRGWAIPTATDIAFALGVLSLLGSRVPTSLKVFLTALAVIDDLGAIVIIAVFYSGHISVPNLAIAAALCFALFCLNRARVLLLWPYLILGLALWIFIYLSGVHPTVAGVLLAMSIPLRATPARPDELGSSPLHRLEHRLDRWVGFLVVPLFGFANAGISFSGVSPEVLTGSLTLGVALGLLAGKLIGVFGSSYLLIRLSSAELPMGASTLQLAGVSLLCGIGFTMSLFIGLLAFEDNEFLQAEMKVGILIGSLAAGVGGWLVLRLAPRRIPAPKRSG
jgi:NhaA family Na+:H+ antiporter